MEHSASPSPAPMTASPSPHRPMARTRRWPRYVSPMGVSTAMRNWRYRSPQPLATTMFWAARRVQPRESISMLGRAMIGWRAAPVATSSQVARATTCSKGLTAPIPITSPAETARMGSSTSVVIAPRSWTACDLRLGSSRPTSKCLPSVLPIWSSVLPARTTG